MKKLLFAFVIMLFACNAWSNDIANQVNVKNEEVLVEQKMDFNISNVVIEINTMSESCTVELKGKISIGGVIETEFSVSATAETCAEASKQAFSGVKQLAQQLKECII